MQFFYFLFVSLFVKKEGQEYESTLDSLQICCGISHAYHFALFSAS